MFQLIQTRIIQSKFFFQGVLFRENCSSFLNIRIKKIFCIVQSAKFIFIFRYSMNEKQRSSRNSLFSTESERSLKSKISDQFLFYIPLIFSLILLIGGIILFLFIEQKNKHVEIVDKEPIFQFNSTLDGLKLCFS